MLTVKQEKFLEELKKTPSEILTDLITCKFYANTEEIALFEQDYKDFKFTVNKLYGDYFYNIIPGDLILDNFKTLHKGWHK